MQRPRQFPDRQIFDRTGRTGQPSSEADRRRRPRELSYRRRTMAAVTFGGVSEESFVGGLSPLRQGDVLQFVSASPTAEEWESHLGVLVTANCDLVHAKSGGVVTYVPVVPLGVYVRVFTVPALVGRHAERSEASLADLMERAGVTVTRSRVEEMLGLGVSAEEISALAQLETSVARDFIRIVSRIKACWAARDEAAGCTTVGQAISVLIRLRATLNTLEVTPSKKPIEHLVKTDLLDRLRNLPNDTMFLGSVDKFPEVHVAYLRLLRELRPDRIALSPRDERLQPDADYVARRICRLQVLYIHKLLQQMAAVFTDIGLPEDYEAHRGSTFSSHIDSWLGHVETLR